MLDRLLPVRRLLGRGEKFCVYTSLIGGYERLNEQPAARQSKIPFLCLTDDPNLRSETWRIIPVEPLFPQDPIRSQRMFKILPHRFLPDFDASLYIDNSVVLSKPPEEILNRYFRSGYLALPTHSFRETVLDEYLVVERVRLDDSSRIFEQLNHVALSDPRVLLERPYWNGVLMRRHRSKVLQRALELWAMHVQRYSRRDQLSANVAFKAAGLKPRRIEIDNHHSWFHDWPIKTDRNSTNATRRPGASLGAVMARLGTSEGQDKALLDRVVSAQRQPRKQPPDVSSVRCANGRVVYVDPADERGAHLIRMGGDVNPPTLAMWRLLLAERDWTHIVDVGANYGEMLLGADLPSSATVIGVEPNPNVLPYLKRSIGEAGLTATIVAEALSAQSGTAELVTDRTWSGLTRLGRLSPDSVGHVVEVLEVPTTTLDSVVSRTTAAGPIRVLVKIDVEGHEAMVLEGARKLIERADWFAALVELHHNGDGDLDWMLSHFAIELYDPKTAALVPSAATDARALRDEIAAKGLYGLDAVLRPRNRSGDLTA